jgi:hypothetical protein
MAQKAIQAGIETELAKLNSQDEDPSVRAIRLASLAILVQQIPEGTCAPGGRPRTHTRIAITHFAITRGLACINLTCKHKRKSCTAQTGLMHVKLQLMSMLVEHTRRA